MAGPNFWDQDQVVAPHPSGGYTITTQRDPFAVKRDNRADRADARSADAAARSAANETARIQLERQRFQHQLDQDNGPGALDPATINLYAQQVLAGAPMPAIGMGKQAAAARLAIMGQVAKLSGAAGLTGFDQAAQIAHYKAGSKQIGTLENMAGTIGVNEQTALANGQQFLDRSADLPGQTRFAPVNAVSDWIQRRFGGTTISAMDAAHTTFVNEYAKVVAGSPSGAGTLSDSARREAMDTIQSDASMDQKQAAFAQMKTDMANRLTAIHGGINEAYKALTNRPGYQVPDATQGLALTPQPGTTNGAGVGGLPGGGGRGGGSPSNPGGPPVLDSGGDRAGIANGGTKTVIDPTKAAGVAALQSLLRSGAPDEQVRAAASALGAEPDSVEGALGFRRRNPAFHGSYPLGDLGKKDVPTTWGNYIAGSAPGTALGSTADHLLGGLSDEIAGTVNSAFNGKTVAESVADANAAKQAAFAANPKSALLGGMVGDGLGLLGVTKGAQAVGLGARVGAKALPYLASGAWGAIEGAGQDNDNRLGGAAMGGGGGLLGEGLGQLASVPLGALARTRAGQAVGNAVAAPINRVRGMFGSSPLALPSPAQPLSSADQAYSAALTKAGPANVTGQLSEASSLGIPMSPADTHPELRELAGAAVRRSPTASQFAESTLIPRNRGQIDRFGNAVTRDLGPVGNIPQQSADLTTQARAAAAPLYAAAYGVPVPHTPELGSLLQTPFGSQALARARTIAANERRSPSEFGFALDDQGNTVLNPQPTQAMAQHLAARSALDDAQAGYRTAKATPGMDMAAAANKVQAARQGLRDAEASLNAAPDPTQPASVPAYTQQTLDYTKRGMDDVLEQQRNPLTGRLQLDEAGRAQNLVRNQFLSENDRLNPAFATARQAYQGPVAARDAMLAGQDAMGLTPDELRMQVASQSPGNIPQMQLGYRGALIDRANSVRDNANPFEATLGTPASRQRLDALYPNDPGPANLYRQRDLEGQLQDTSNAVLGNSKTAQRKIADFTFTGTGGGVPGMAAEAALAVLTHGASLPFALRRLGSQGARDAYRLGVGNAAVSKADALAPLLLNTDPNAGIADIGDLMARSDAWQRYVTASRPTRPLGMFGSSLGTTLGAPN